MSIPMTYINRHNIFNSTGDVIAYDLVYDLPPQPENESLHNDLFTQVLKNPVIENIIGTHLIFVTIDEPALFSDFISALNAEQFVLTLSSSTNASVDILKRVDELSEKGFKFALDDIMTTPAAISAISPFLPYIQYIKIDVERLHESDIINTLSRLKPYSLTFMAKNVSDRAAYDHYISYGFALFEGVFYENPLVLDETRIDPLTSKVLDLISQLNEETSVSEVENAFMRYPDLLFNLLRHMNSAAFGFSNEIKSIRHALMLLGKKRLVAWLSLFLYADKHKRAFGTALLKTALFRAKAMEDLCVLSGRSELKESAFLTGVLSLISAYLQKPIEHILMNVRLQPAVSDAVVYATGELGELLTLSIQLENGAPADYNYPNINAEKIYEIIANAHAFSDLAEQAV